MKRKIILDPIEKIMEKKEFSDLPKEDVKLVYSLFSSDDSLSEEEKIKFTRDSLRKMYTAFISEKLLVNKERDAEWFLKKHISTLERFPFYSDVYSKILSYIKNEKNKRIVLFDFGCGVNGFSFEKFLKFGFDVRYMGTEPVGQLSNIQNNWFKKNNFEGCVKKLSLFDIKSNKELIINSKKGDASIGFFFKVIDSLELFKKDYSKKVLNELVPFLDLVVVSFATKSLIKKRSFRANRKWLKDFINVEFFILDEFEIGGETYIVFKKKEDNLY